MAEKTLRFGGPALVPGQVTWYMDAWAPSYNLEDLDADVIVGEGALAAIEGKPGAKLYTHAIGGGLREIGAAEAAEIAAVDPQLVQAIVPKLDERGQRVPKEGAKPAGYGQVHVNFGDEVPLSRVVDAENYLTRGMARVIDPEDKAPRRKPAASAPVADPAPPDTTDVAAG